MHAILISNWLDGMSVLVQLAFGSRKLRKEEGMLLAMHLINKLLDARVRSSGFGF